MRQHASSARLTCQRPILWPRGRSRRAARPPTAWRSPPTRPPRRAALPRTRRPTQGPPCRSHPRQPC
jgi:hypothetical protein